jgi:hypothetical protein
MKNINTIEKAVIVSYHYDYPWELRLSGTIGLGGANNFEEKLKFLKKALWHDRVFWEKLRNVHCL